ncbi:MAG: SGNH/GDSL hydrolase family protein [Kiritimatiellae bacterium]|nr:SGNH/GDSL hydrolase family protein [Kiritimatiellia bacterium]
MMGSLVFALCGALEAAPVCPSERLPIDPAAQPMQSHWKGKKVAFLGDSITDANHIGTSKNYWQYLPEILGIESHIYGINGHQWTGVLDQAKRLKAEMGDSVDAIFIFAGTNDFNGSVPLGEWWTIEERKVNAHGQEVTRPRRIMQADMGNFRGRINVVMAYLKELFPRQQIILMTPIHRAFATFGGNNIQPDESFPNGLGLYVDAYVEVIKEAANVWSVPVIDLHSVSGLNPLIPAHSQFFNNPKTDLLHPNAEGHKRIARAMACQMLALPSDFK